MLILIYCYSYSGDRRSESGARHLAHRRRRFFNVRLLLSGDLRNGPVLGPNRLDQFSDVEKFGSSRRHGYCPNVGYSDGHVRHYRLVSVIPEIGIPSRAEYFENFHAFGCRKRIISLGDVTRTSKQ